MSVIEAKASLFYVLVPYTDADLRAKLKKDGMVFHWSTGDQRCPPRCSACEAGLPSFVWFTRDPTIASKTGLELSPSAKALVARTPGQLEASRADSAMVRVPLPPGRVLRPYQLAAVAYAATRKGVLIGDEMGIGKSIEAIAIANTMSATSRILVICPASLKANWRKEIMLWDAHNPRVTLCEEGQDVPDPAPGREWCVTNAERLISTRARTAESVSAKIAPDREGKRLAKLVKLDQRQRILWVAWPDVPKPDFPEGVLYSVGYSPGELVFASHPGPIIVRVPPGGVGQVILQDQPFGWTHVIGDTSHNLAGAERAGNLWQILMATTWDLLILDEAHRFVNLKASTSERVLGVRRGRKREAALGIAQRSNRILALTGTPIPNRVRNLWALISVLAPDVFRKEGDFLFRYCGPTRDKIYVKGGRGKQIEVMNFDGATNLDELQERLRSVLMIRRLKKDVLADLPEKTRQILPLSGDKIRDAADAEREAWLKLVPSMSDTVLEAMLAEAVGDSFAFEQALTRLQTDLSGIDAKAIAKERQATALAKVPLVVEHVRDALEASPRKVVIAAHHQSVIRALEEAFGPMAVSLYGETPVKDRQAVVDRFQTDPKIRVFIAGMHAAGVGITLTAADLMVFAEGDWLPWVLLQMEDRIHRIGQQFPVLIQYLVVDGSIEALVIASALQKQFVIDRALDAQPEGTRKEYPKATELQRVSAKLALDGWKMPGSLPERVSKFIEPMLARAAKRPLTDGEVWLCQQIAIQNPKSVFPKFLEALMGPATPAT